MRAIIAACILALSGCETIRIQGVEITREDQIGWGLFLAVTGAAIYHLAEGNQSDGPQKQQCKRVTEAGDCSIPFDTF